MQIDVWTGGFIAGLAALGYLSYRANALNSWQAAIDEIFNRGGNGPNVTQTVTIQHADPTKPPEVVTVKVPASLPVVDELDKILASRSVPNAKRVSLITPLLPHVLQPDPEGANAS